MAITDAKKVDYLWKKLGYGATKTDTNAAKKAPNEAIASPLLLRGDKVWNQANGIPGTMPGANTDVVTVYLTTAPDECAEDTTATTSRSWKTGLTDWIPPEFGSTYAVKVYIHTASNVASAAGSGTRVYAAGSGNNDEFFFDYQSGVLHFIGTNLPNGVSFSGKSCYVSGARYTGTVGVQNNVAATGNFTFDGSGINQDVTNSDFTLGTSGTGQYIFSSNTGIVVPTGTTAERPTAQEGVIRFNTQTGKYEVSEDGSTWANLSTGASASSITKDIFTGDGSTTAFTMSTTPANVRNVVLYIDGVMQEPTTNYTMSGTTVTTAGEAAHIGARIVVMHGFAD
jgi:hypothetical protein